MYNDENNRNNNFAAEQESGMEENRGNNRQRKNKKKKALTAALAVCCLTAAAGGTTLLQASGSDTTLQIGSRDTTEAVALSSVDTSTELTAAELYAKYVNSTVGITTSTTTNFWGYETESAASGSGFILTEDGYILTNYHVIEDSDTITVTMYDGNTYDAELTGYDESNDIAVLKVDASGLTPVVLGDSDILNVGDEVAAIGNPLGELTFSLTTGVISAKDRQITMSTGVTMNLLQTDCAINSGNSGGALFNMYGEVVGITNAKYSSSGSSSEASVDNIGFAIPISSVVSEIQSIMTDGTVTKPYIGVSVTDLSSNLQSYVPSGAVVASVTSGSPAEEAGLQENDIITKAGDTEITSASDLSALVKTCSEGDVLTLTVYRQGETLELEVTVGSQTQSATGEEDSSSDSSTDGSGQNGGFGGGFGGGYGNGGSFGNGGGYGSDSGNDFGDGSDYGSSDASTVAF